MYLLFFHLFEVKLLAFKYQNILWLPIVLNNILTDRFPLSVPAATVCGVRLEGPALAQVHP